jgi:hypothetical protein
MTRKTKGRAGWEPGATHKNTTDTRENSGSQVKAQVVSHTLLLSGLAPRTAAVLAASGASLSYLGQLLPATAAVIAELLR